MIIGITGRGCSGKSTLASKIIQKHSNFIYIDVDNIVETRVLNSVELINKANQLFTDRKYTIDDIVMAYFDKNEKNNILHLLFAREVAKHINEIIFSSKTSDFVIDWFLLHEIFHLLPLDVKLMTFASRKKRIDRAKIRQNSEDTSMFEKVDNAYIDIDPLQIDYVINTEKEYTEMIDVIINEKGKKI